MNYLLELANDLLVSKILSIFNAFLKFHINSIYNLFLFEFHLILM